MAIVFSVTYHKNDGSGTNLECESTTKATLDSISSVGQNWGVSPQNWTRSGYVFVNWNSEADGSGTSYEPGDIFTGREAIVYAIWQGATPSHDVTISYNNATIATMDASGTEVLETDGTICADDITIEYVKPAAPTPSLQAKTNIAPTTSSQTITPDSGYDGLSSVQINAMPQGSATTPYTVVQHNPAIVYMGGMISTSTNLTISVTPTVSPGYVSSGTAGNVKVQGYNEKSPSSLDSNLVAGNIKKDISIFGVTGTYEGGGAGTPTLSTSVPQYMVNVALVTYGQYRESVPGYYVPPVGETVYFDTAGRWELSSLYEEATGTPVPFTTISTSRNGSKYSFVMPNAAVLFDLYYND